MHFIKNNWVVSNSYYIIQNYFICVIFYYFLLLSFVSTLQSNI